MCVWCTVIRLHFYHFRFLEYSQQLCNSSGWVSLFSMLFHCRHRYWLTNERFRATKYCWHFMQSVFRSFSIFTVYIIFRNFSDIVVVSVLWSSLALVTYNVWPLLTLMIKCSRYVIVTCIKPLTTTSACYFHLWLTPCGLRGWKNRLAQFPVQMS